MATEQKWIESMEKLLADAKREDLRLKAGVKCAGTELRRHLKGVTQLCKEGRKEALETRKAIPKAVPKPKKVTKKPSEEVAELKEEPASEPAVPVSVSASKAKKPEPESKMPWKETEPKLTVSKRAKKPVPV